MKLIVALLVALALVIVACDPLPPAPNHANYHWSEVFTDDFNGSAIDTAKWSECADWNYGTCTDDFNGGRAHYVPGTAAEGYGAAVLPVTPSPGDVQLAGCQAPGAWAGECTYKAGMLSTARPVGTADPTTGYKFKFTRGYAEARIKIMGQPGLFSSWWMLTANDTSNAQNWSALDGEIDVMENRGAFPRTAFMGYHGPPARTDNHYVSPIAVEDGGNNGACTTANLSADYHVYGMQWHESYVSWYIDNVKCGQFNLTTTTKPMYLILAPMVDTQWERDSGAGIGASRPSSAMLVDWVRIWQEAPN